MTENERADEADCLRLMTTYANTLDRRDMEGFGQVFTEDAVWRRTNVREVELRGRDEIVKHVARLPEGVVNKHMILNAEVTEIDGDTARGECVGLVIDGAGSPDALPAPLDGVHLVLEYRDHYRRDAGQWRIERREMTTVLDRGRLAGDLGVWK